MSKYKGQHGGKKGKIIRARPSPPPFPPMPERNRFFLWEVFPYLGRFQKRWRIVIFLYISVQCQWQIQGLSLCIAEMALVSFEVRNQNQNFLFFQGRSMCWLNILRMHCKKVYTVTTVGNGYMSVWSWRGVHGLQTTCDYFEPKFISSTNNWAKTRKTDKTSFSTIGFLF